MTAAVSISRDSELLEGIPLKAEFLVSPQPNRSLVEKKQNPASYSKSKPHLTRGRTGTQQSPGGVAAATLWGSHSHRKSPHLSLGPMVPAEPPFAPSMSLPTQVSPNQSCSDLDHRARRMIDGSFMPLV